MSSTKYDLLTPRNLEVYSCICAGKPQKEIAQLLNLSVKTIENNIAAIGNILESRGRVGLIRHAENHGLIYKLNLQYINILITYKRKKKYKNIIMTVIDEPSPSIYIYYHECENIARALACKLQDFGFKVKIKSEITTAKKGLRIQKEPSLITQTKVMLFLTPEECDTFAECKIIQTLFPHSKINDIMSNFVKESQTLLTGYGESPSKKLLFNDRDLQGYSFNYFNKLRGVAFWIGGGVVAILVLLAIHKSLDFPPARKKLPSIQQNSIHFEWEEPKVVLPRNDLLKEIKYHLNKKSNHIPLVKITGESRTGKTTLARLFSCNYIKDYPHTTFSGEVDGSSPESILKCFIKIGYSLARNKAEKDSFKKILLLDKVKCSEKIIKFVRMKLCRRKWIMVIDNFRDFKSLDTYLPLCPKKWGHGKVIVVVDPGHIDQSRFFQGHSIEVNYLTQFERETFLSLYYYKRSYDLLSSSQKTFISGLSRELKRKTPYSILRLPKNYQVKLADFLMLDGEYQLAKNIYKEVLTTLENSPLQNNHLRARLTASLANAYREIGEYERALHYIENSLDLYALLPMVSKSPTLNRLFILYNNLKSIKNSQEVVDVYKKTKESNPPIKKCHYNDERSSDIFTAFLYLSVIYRESISFRKSQIFAAEVSQHLTKCVSANDHNLGLSYRLLGNVSRRVGEYDESLKLLKKAAEIYIDNYGEDHFQTILSKNYLGCIYREIGDYKKSIFLLREVQSYYLNKYGPDHFEYAWVATNLGYALSLSGCDEESLIYLKSAYKAFSKNKYDHHIMKGWCMILIGYTYTSLGDYTFAQKWLKNGFNCFLNVFPKNHPRIMWAMLNYARLKRSMLLNDSKNIRKNLYDLQKLMKQILEIDELSRINMDISWRNNEIALNFLVLNDIEKAHKYFYKEQKYTHLLPMFHQGLYQLFIAKSHCIDGDLSKFFHHRKVAILHLRKAIKIGKDKLPQSSRYMQKWKTTFLWEKFWFLNGTTLWYFLGNLMKSLSRLYIERLESSS